MKMIIRLCFSIQETLFEILWRQASGEITGWSEVYDGG